MSEKNLKSLRFHGLDDIYKIPSTAEDVGATPISHLNNSDNPHNVTASQVGAAVPSDVTNAKTMAINESKTYTNAQVKKAAPRNLLDNSDWRVKELIVNQRGEDSYAGKVYGIDRWYGRVTDQTVSVRDGDITVTATSNSYAGIKQKIEDIAKYAGKTVTLVLNVYSTKSVAVGFVDASDTALADKVDNISGRRSVICTFTIPYGVTPDTVIPRLLLRSTTANDYMRLYWAALYEGEYTEDTLPEYQPKGYAVELSECQRYYCNSWFGVGKSAQNQILGSPWNTDSADFPIYFPQTMAGTPNVTYYGSFNRDVPKIFSGGAYQDCGNIATNHRLGLHSTYARVTKSGADTSTWTIGSIIQLHAHWEAEVPM